MKERLVTLALALGSLALLYAFFMPKPSPVGEAPPLPVTTEIRAEGYQALWRWLSAQSVPVVSFRDRYPGLAATAAAPSGNLLVATLPQQQLARPAELSALDDWVKQGNTLLVLAALDDTPAWTGQAGMEFLLALERMTGIRFAAIREAQPEDEEAPEDGSAVTLRQSVMALLAPKDSSIIPRGSHPLLAGVGSIATRSRFTASRWETVWSDSAALLVLGDRADRAPGRDEPEPAMWLRRWGDGQVIVLAFASPFSNELIGQQDNARLFANIVAWSRTGAGAVLFDDAHQGLVNYYDARAFFGDSRLHRTLLWVFGLWLVYVLGWQRIRPHADAWQPVDVTTLLKVTGGLFARKVPQDQVGGRLLANFFNGIRQRLALPQDGEPLWEWLGAQGGIQHGDLARLRRLHLRVEARQHVDLVELQNCLTKITGCLA